MVPSPFGPSSSLLSHKSLHLEAIFNLKPPYFNLDFASKLGINEEVYVSTTITVCVFVRQSQNTSAKSSETSIPVIYETSK